MRFSKKEHVKKTKANLLKQSILILKKKLKGTFLLEKIILVNGTFRLCIQKISVNKGTFAKKVVNSF